MGNFMIIGSVHTQKRGYLPKSLVILLSKPVINEDITSNNKNFFQFLVILHVLAHGRHITKFENMSSFLGLMKVNHYLEQN
jgi:hypothetical protein